MVLPDGTLVVGTGGEGHICVTSVMPDVIDVPIGIGPPVPNAPIGTKSTRGGVLLRNPSENAQPVSYLISRRWDYTLEPDHVHNLGEGDWRIHFSRGSAESDASYKLEPGTYAFGPSDKGWELYREHFSVTIDNSKGDDEFHYVVDNRQARVGPGKSRAHESDYPIAVRFNRGADGDEALKKITEPHDHLAVAVNPRDGLWDLFRADGEAAATAVASEPRDRDSGSSEPPPEPMREGGEEPLSRADR
jgi:hypothetical protein